MMNIKMFALFLAVLMATEGAFCSVGVTHAIFKNSSGDVIELSAHAVTFRNSGSNSFVLYDCGDKYQICLTDNHGFSFAYFRMCNGVDYSRLKFDPRVVSVLGGNLWIVFNDYPNYMFHYMIKKGIVGIYTNNSHSFDFRSLLRYRKLQLAKYDSLEYRILAGSDSVAACDE